MHVATGLAKPFWLNLQIGWRVLEPLSSLAIVTSEVLVKSPNILIVKFSSEITNTLEVILRANNCVNRTI